MKVKINIDDSVLIREIERQYGIPAARIDFIPLGDQGYSYKVLCADGDTYFLKAFDQRTQQINIAQLEYYLPLTSYLYENHLFRRLTYPIRNRCGRFRCDLEQITFVLFNYIEGDTLAEAYPFSKQIIRNVAESLSAVHQIAPQITDCPVRRDSFDVTFLKELRRNIGAIFSSGAGRPHSARLAALITPYKHFVKEMISSLAVMQSSLATSVQSMVLCHGDLWGGNIIVSGGHYYLIDWESALIAPRERDLFQYAGDDFADFLDAYENTLGKAVSVSPEIIRFYAYRRHLGNLNQWLTNILYKNLPEAQIENDLEMIAHHCLNRLELVEPQVKTVQLVLDDRRTRMRYKEERL